MLTTSRVCACVVFVFSAHRTKDGKCYGYVLQLLPLIANKFLCRDIPETFLYSAEEAMSVVYVTNL
jgi:hypothetical protein